MHEHGPDELIGPLRGTPSWWSGTGAGPESTDDGSPLQAQPKKKRKDAKPIRMELVARVRQQIAAGTYDTEERWQAALDRLLDRLDTDD